MRKILLMITLLFCCVSVVSAQSDNKFRYGVTGGMNISSTTSEYADAKIGFQLGLRGEYGFGENLYLGAALMYDHKGWKVDGEAGNAGYINLPIHVGYKLNFTDNFLGFAEVGPYFAYGITGNMMDIDGINKFDVGIGARIGVEFSKFQVHIGYDYGLTDLADVEDAAKNTNIMVGVSYFF
jgi:hypothetical protein